MIPVRSPFSGCQTDPIPAQVVAGNTRSVNGQTSVDLRKVVLKGKFVNFFSFKTVRCWYLKLLLWPLKFSLVFRSSRTRPVSDSVKAFMQKVCWKEHKCFGPNILVFESKHPLWAIAYNSSPYCTYCVVFLNIFATKKTNLYNNLIE